MFPISPFLFHKLGVWGYLAAFSKAMHPYRRSIPSHREMNLNFENLRRLACALLFHFAVTVGHGRIWHVDAKADPNGDGLSWSSALPNIPQGAIVKSGDEIWLMAGVYALDATLKLPTGTKIVGGFGDYFGQSAVRQHVLSYNRSILLQRRPRCSVVELSGVDAVTLDGIIITGANGCAGLRIVESSNITVRNCAIEKNLSLENGGGIAVSNSKRVKFWGCRIAENATSFPANGGGISVDASSMLSWMHCVVAENVSGGNLAGGVLLRSVSGNQSDFVGCDFYYNESGSNGSALDADSPILLRDSTICSNLVRIRDSGSPIAIHGPRAKAILAGDSYVVSNLRDQAEPHFAPAVDGLELCEVSPSVVLSNETGPASIALYTGRNDVHLFPRDVFTPELSSAAPAAGLWTRQTLPGFDDTKAYHCMYLPTDWRPGKQFPVLVSFPGNGPYRNRYGDRSGGLPEDNPMGYGLSGGRGFIVLSLGYLDSRNNMRPTETWWGDVSATISYCREAVAYVCKNYGGDSSNLILLGFSRSAIGAGFIGLNDTNIAGLWRAFICYDGWESQVDMMKNRYGFGKYSFNYDRMDFESSGVEQRFRRLAGRPVFILGGSGEARELNAKYNWPVEFMEKSHRNHNTTWALRDTPERARIRAWLEQVIRR